MSNWAAIYSQADLLGYTAPEPIVVPALPSVLAPPPPLRQHAFTDIWKGWELATVRLLIFNDRATGAQVTIAGRTMKEFISPGRGTALLYSMSILDRHHDYVTPGQYDSIHCTVKGGEGIRIDYVLPGSSLMGYAVFCDQAGTNGRWPWLLEKSKHIFLGGPA